MAFDPNCAKSSWQQLCTIFYMCMVFDVDMQDDLENWDLPWKGVGDALLQRQLLTYRGLHVKPARHRPLIFVLFQTLKWV